jgi:6-phosphogluconolactonase
MEADSLNLELAANNYSKLLPKSIDLLMLSVGEDGHISSLFPHSPVLHELQRSVVPVVGFKPPFSRLTITPQVIQSARNIIVIAEGIEKRKIYEKALQDPEDIDSIPARLVLNRTWVFD